jgi:hypothetical protein
MADPNDVVRRSEYSPWVVISWLDAQGKLHAQVLLLVDARLKRIELEEAGCTEIQIEIIR